MGKDEIAKVDKEQKTRKGREEDGKKKSKGQNICIWKKFADKKKDAHGLMKSRKKEGQWREGQVGQGQSRRRGSFSSAGSKVRLPGTQVLRMRPYWLRSLELNCLDLDPDFSINCRASGKIFNLSKPYCLIY